MLNKRGFTLMEALIAASVFGMLSVIAATFFLNISQSQRSTDSYSALYEDARVIMENLANEIRNGTVDYEEYYNITSNDIKRSADYYGINRGVYSSRFYDPGYKMNNNGTFSVGLNPENLGVECLGENGLKTPCPGVTTFNLSVDKDMGKNKYNGEVSSAISNSVQQELYIISKDGRSKTIVVNQKMNSQNDHALSILRLNGEDTDSNGVIDGFFCSADTKGCKGVATEVIQPFIPLGDTKTVAMKYNEEVFGLSSSPFTPISPLRSNVKEIKFVITPTEDPYKAFDEKDVQYHPSVTIVMTLEPSAAEKGNLPSEQQNQSITVQTTVAAGVTSRIKTYPPTKDLGWIQNVVNSI